MLFQICPCVCTPVCMQAICTRESSQDFFRFRSIKACSYHITANKKIFNLFSWIARSDWNMYSFMRCYGTVWDCFPPIFLIWLWFTSCLTNNLPSPPPPPSRLFSPLLTLMLVCKHTKPYGLTYGTGLYIYQGLWVCTSLRAQKPLTCKFICKNLDSSHTRQSMTRAFIKIPAALTKTL